MKNRYPKARYDYWRPMARVAWWRDVWQGALERIETELRLDGPWGVGHRTAKRYQRILRHENEATDRIYTTARR